MRVHALEMVPGGCISFNAFAYSNAQAYTLIDILRWKWKVKKWQISVDFTVKIIETDEVVGGLSFVTELADGEQRTTDEFGSSSTFKYPDERYKVCPYNTTLLDSAGFSASFGRAVTPHPIFPDFFAFECVCEIDVAGFAARSTSQLPDGSSSGIGDSPLFYFDQPLIGGGANPFYGVNPSLACLGYVQIIPSVAGGGYWPFERSDNTIPLFDTDSGTQLVPTDSEEFIFIG